MHQSMPFSVEMAMRRELAGSTKSCTERADPSTDRTFHCGRRRATCLRGLADDWGRDTVAKSDVESESVSSVRVTTPAMGEVEPTTWTARWYQRGTKKRPKAARGKATIAKRMSGIGESVLGAGDIAANSAKPPAPPTSSDAATTKRR
jgi:hypothetical protein